ncbi:MAG TPA: imelysin family protein [Haliangium sp.]|nr:imelysin family protein [Haliangium sp.]
MRNRRLLISASAAVTLAALFGACGDDNSNPVPTIDAAVDTFDRKMLLANIGENIALPVYETFHARVTDMATAIDAHCAGLGTADEASLRAATQEAWRQSMNTWQLVEVMLFGPVSMNEGALRDVVYSWPIVSTCAVDQDVNLHRTDPASYDISTRLTNRRGLAALEHVLFSDDLEHTCPIQAAPAGWDTLIEADRKAARCSFAQVAVADLAAQAQTLVAAWRPDAGNYLAMFTSASAFESAQAGLNVVSDAMFYLDTETKDMKLAEPAGIAVNSCNTTGQPCPAELESPRARYSRENVLANLRGFQMLFLGQGLDGVDRVGFDDFLRALDAGAVADQMATTISAAITAVEAIPGAMEDALQSDYQAVVDAHAGVKAVTDILKSQFLTVLGLDLPDGGASDND